jgi:hypothetical protein
VSTIPPLIRIRRALCTRRSSSLTELPGDTSRPVTAGCSALDGVAAKEASPARPVANHCGTPVRAIVPASDSPLSQSTHMVRFPLSFCPQSHMGVPRPRRDSKKLPTRSCPSPILSSGGNTSMSRNWTELHIFIHWRHGCAHVSMMLKGQRLAGYRDKSGLRLMPRRGHE